MREKTRLKVEGLVIGRRRDGKNRYDDAARRRLMSLCDEGVGSVAAIALANGVNPNVLHRWIALERTRGHVDADSNERAPRLLPVLTSDDVEGAREVSGSALVAEASTLSTASTTPDVVAEIVIEFARATLRVRQPLDAKLLAMIADVLSPRC